MEPKKGNKTGGIIATIVTALLCGCTALLTCIFGAFGVSGTPFRINLGDYNSYAPMPLWIGIGLLCLSVILIAVPIVVGVLTLRTKKPAAAITPPPSEPLPPAS